MVCYRRRGHNEGDDPSMTQPLMYNIIDAKRSVRKLYTEALIGRGDITVEEAEEALRDYQEQLERVVRRDPRGRGQADRPTPPAPTPRPRPRAAAAQARRPGRRAAPSTAVDRGRCSASATRTSTRPQGFTVHPKLQQLLERRAAMTREGGIDWAIGELLAFGSLLLEGAPVRLAGQDTPPRHVRPAARGAHRPRDRRGVDAAAPPRRRTRPGSGSTTRCCREFAAMGFEYGYSVERPDALVLWEAQFGDFVNGAQTIVDEFISSGEEKWGQRSSRRAAAAARLRGPGPGPLLGPHRALPAAVRRGQHDGRHTRRRRRSTSTCCAARPRPAAPPADRLHAEVDAAAQGRRVSAVEDFTDRHVPAGAARHRRGSTPPAVDAGAALPRQGLLRPAGRARASASDTDDARSSGSSSSTRCRPSEIARRARALPGRRARLGAGGAGQPGRLAVHGAQPAGAPAGAPGAACAGLAGRRRPPRPPARPRCTTRSRQALVDRRSPLRRARTPVPVAARAPAVAARDSLARVLHRPRHRGARQPARRGGGHPRLAGRAGCRTFVDLNPEFEIPVERLATWLARLDDDED